MVRVASTCGSFHQGGHVSMPGIYCTDAQCCEATPAVRGPPYRVGIKSFNASAVSARVTGLADMPAATNARPCT
jgi:hypothetical protein